MFQMEKYQLIECLKSVCSLETFGKAQTFIPHSVSHTQTYWDDVVQDQLHRK